MSVTRAIGVGIGRIRVTCRDESGGRRYGSSAGRSGEHLAGSGDSSNQLTRLLRANVKSCRTTRTVGATDSGTTDSGILRSVYSTSQYRVSQ